MERDPEASRLATIDAPQGYLAVIEGEGDTYSAHVPDLPVIVAAADTRAEVVRLIQEAVPLYIETLRQRGEPIPPPTTTALTIPVPAA